MHRIMSWGELGSIQGNGILTETDSAYINAPDSTWIVIGLNNVYLAMLIDFLFLVKPYLFEKQDILILIQI